MGFLTVDLCPSKRSTGSFTATAGITQAPLIALAASGLWMKAQKEFDWSLTRKSRRLAVTW
jgi:hypothetical protein